MNKHLQAILNILQRSETLTPDEKKSIDEAVEESDKVITITEFKLERTEKVKRTTSILLEETIAELEQKRKSVEAQNRELEIEASLERIRARAMAMHTSSELIEVANVLREQMRLLDTAELETSAVLIYHNDLAGWDSWYAFRATNDPGERIKNGITTFSKDSCEFTREIVSMYQSPSSDYTLELRGAKREEWLEVLMKAAPEIAANAISTEAVRFDTTYFHFSDFHGGSLLTVSYAPPLEEIKTLQRRAASVFGLAYQRFRDLQKAEAQARESQIQLALERVRARTMAMRRSEELADAAQLLFQQVKGLGVQAWTSGFQLWDKDWKAVTVWTSTEGVLLPPFKLPSTEDPLMIHIVDAARKGETLYVEEMSGKALEDHYRYMFSLPSLVELFGTVSSGGHTPPTSQVNHAAFFSYGFLLFITYEPCPEAHDIFKRFAKVFDQTYTRFLDLQKAEAQAREAQIEAALERVRTRSMAMHKSEELGELSFELVKQVQALGIATWHCAFNIYDEGQESSTEWGSNAEGSYPIYKTPREGIFRQYYEAGLRGEILHIEEIGEDRCADHYTYLCTLPGVGETLLKVRDSGIPFPKSQIDHVAYFKYGYLLFITFEPAPDAHDVFKRFAKVFEQTYTRFLDLQKAEAQAREAQIEAGLERVRSRSMAMQRSDELLDVASILFQQVKALGVPQWNCGFDIWNIGDTEFTYYPGSPDGKILGTPCKIPLTEHPVFKRMDESRRRGDDLLIYEKHGEEQKDHYQYMLSLPGLGDFLRSMLDVGFQLPTFQIDHVANFSYGNLIFITYEHFPEMHDVFKRFAKVFEQTYTRFLDLQKAEAQARESQIEAALEKVRSRSLAMHDSNELREVVVTVFEKLQELNFSISDGAVGIMIFNENSRDHVQWMTDPVHSYATPFKVSYSDHSLPFDIFNAREMGADFFSKIYPFEEKNTYFEFLFQHSNEYKRLPEDVKRMILEGNEYGISIAYAKNSAIAIPSPSGKLITETEREILKRFARVFEQAYVRFLDLQKAEAQARESQIEAALERVRSKTMAMHNSQDVGDTVATLFDELTKLGVKTNRCGILIFGESSDTEVWTAKSTPSGEVNLIIGHLDVTMHPMLTGARNAWKNKDASYSYIFSGDDLITYYKTISNHPDYPIRFNLDALPSKEIHTDFFFPEGAVFAFTAQPIEPEHAQILKRLAGVFGQTYRRYLDLLKAEAQAREATIEASLERVRGKAMAMHNSNDLIATTSLVFTELRKLGIKSFRSGVGLLTKENRKVKLYSATSSAEGDGLSVVGWAILDDHPVLKNTYDSWIRNEDYFPVLRGEDIRSYYEKVVSTFSVPVAQSVGAEQHGYFLSFSEGIFYGWSEKPYTESEIKILHRFKGIVDLTFRRYMELQKSEANAMEAIRQASVDRVRAEIASMRTTTDLDRITPLIWKELSILGIPFVRCGVFIMDEKKDQIHTFLSTPDGKAIAAFHLPYDTPGNIGEILSHWADKRMYISHWNETAFSELGELLVQQGAIPSKDVYMSTVPEGGIHLHCLPFIQGMLYVGNTTQLKQDDIHLIQSVADAFSTAYARYEDFNMLESAKVQIEKTLADLKQTQTQLVQSEKMASLGELTAGIAHEIQNPLNFVNNFSEVNKELLAEMSEEIKKGNFGEVWVIANDIIRNEEKINHHGKRADAIVKSMLQHTASGSGVKEPTDVNALADEYLRLAYHGMRAKDKSFNVSMKTDFDESIGSINVVRHELGRVILNLVTNAFYVVSERKKQLGSDYEPTVALTTRKNGDWAFISIKDNGHGISQKVLDKIFQPFFTTKPAGQGTGLGLSLSYDIVKAHGGELKVETKEGSGSEFIVHIPLV